MSTPIDPADEIALKDAYEAGVSNAHQGGIPSTSHWQGLVHVARAVCPEHHVVVPVDEIEKALEIMVWGSSGTSAEQDTMAYFHSLIPAESEAV